MTAERFAQLWCDEATCSRRFTHAGEVGEVRDAAAAFGWTYSHPGRDRCPTHDRRRPATLES